MSKWTFIYPSEDYYIHEYLDKLHQEDKTRPRLRRLFKRNKYVRRYIKHTFYYDTVKIKKKDGRIRKGLKFILARRNTHGSGPSYLPKVFKELKLERLEPCYMGFKIVE
jgi:hypothetical protein